MKLCSLHFSKVDTSSYIAHFGCLNRFGVLITLMPVDLQLVFGVYAILNGCLFNNFRESIIFLFGP